MERLLLLPLLVAFVTVFSLTAAEDVDAIVSLSNELAADIHKKLSAEDENVFFSPFSLSTVLAMLFYGARGKTAEEMRNVLGYNDERLTNSEVHSSFKKLLETFDGDSAKEYILYVANAVMTQKGFPILPEYQKGLQSTYKATARELDFQNDAADALRTINDWVKLNTNNQIEKLLDDVDPTTVMVLLNAVYFKGTWKTQFDPEETFEMPFFNRGLESERIRIETMHVQEELPYLRLGGVRILELPYSGEDISMVIALPDARNGLARLEKELSANFWKDIVRQTRKVETTVFLPKFKLEYEKTLNKVLQDYGLKSIFNNPDLSGISKSGPLEVSKIIHKAVLEVNEQGSEASAISGGLIDFKMGNDKNVFAVNHPFVFAIFDKRSQLVLFQGRVNKL